MEPNYELTDDHAASHLTDKQRLAVDCIVQRFTGPGGGQGDQDSQGDRVQVALEFVKQVDLSGCH